MSASKMINDELLLNTKTQIGKLVVSDSLSRFTRPVILWSGGKSSMVVLHLIKSLFEKSPFQIPLLMLDDGQHFQETLDFANDVSRRMNITILRQKNEDILAHLGKSGLFNVSDLNNESKALLKSLGYQDGQMQVSPDSELFNYLLKVLPLQESIRKYRFDSVFFGDRWARSKPSEFYVFLHTNDRPHWSEIRPILPFSDDDIWNYIHQYDVPVNPLYDRGYKTIDGKFNSEFSSEAHNNQKGSVPERIGSIADEEAIRQKLKDLGYE